MPGHRDLTPKARRYAALLRQARGEAFLRAFGLLDNDAMWRGMGFTLRGKVGCRGHSNGDVTVTLTWRAVGNDRNKAVQEIIRIGHTALRDAFGR